MSGPGLGESARLDVRAPAGRTYAVGFLDAVGLGCYLAVVALYLNQAVGLSLGQVGLLLSVTGAASVLGLLPLARAAQRAGLRRGLITLFSARSLAFALLASAQSLLAVAAALILTGLLSRGTAPLVESLLIGRSSSTEAVPRLARLRMVRNAGLALGAVPVGFVVSQGDAELYRAVLLGSAGLFALSAVLVSTVTAAAGTAAAAPPPRSLTVFQDKPFRRLTIIYGCLTISGVLLLVGVPLWIVNQSSAPDWSVAAVQLINTLLVVALQVRASRGTDQLSVARAAMRRGGLLAAAASAVLALSASSVPWLDLTLVLLGVLLFTLSELLFVAGGEGAVLHYIPDGQRATYLAAFNLGFAVATVVAPTLVALTVGLPAWSWLLWAAFFLLSSVVAGRDVPVAK